MPKEREIQRNSADEEDRRMVEEVREISLRELGLRGSASHESGPNHGNRDRSRDSRDEGRRQRRRDDRRRRDERQSTTHGATFVSPGAIDSTSQARQIEHQSSLRSLLSNSNFDSSELEEEILQQIVEEGLLDGIDLDSLNLTQQDELSERIADAYRRRHGRRSRTVNTRDEVSAPVNRTPAEQPRHRHHGRSSSVADQTAHPSHPSVSRSRLLEARPSSQEHRRRSADNGRRQTSPTPGSFSARAATDLRREAGRSATDPSERSRTSATGRTRPGTALPNQGRRTTDPDTANHPRIHLPPPQSPRTRVGTVTSASADPPTNTTRNTNTSQPAANAEAVLGSNPDLDDQTTRLLVVPAQENSRPVDTPSPAARPSSSSSNSVQPPQYPEPSIKCNRCSKSQLEYELHWNCSSCLEGKYDLCLHCYHHGAGCLHWYGFGNAALQRYERQAPPGGYSPNHSLPHVLTGHRYLCPKPGVRQPTQAENAQQMTSDDPANRLQSGVFCFNCSAFANDCFWKCDHCNEGEWGFCNSCVNQGQCCTHPLLPLAHSLTKGNSTSSFSTQHTETSFASTQPLVGSFPDGPYTPLNFRTKCDICTHPIPPSSSRFHCPQCNAGDYDICTTCYTRLVSSGRISAENGHKGWRRCLKGHRMIITGFQDSPYPGQRRVVVKELVGGHALKDDVASPSSASEPRSIPGEGKWTWREGQQVHVRTITKHHPQPSIGSAKQVPDPAALSPRQQQQQLPQQSPIFPPDGGVGMKVLAQWSFWPEAGAENELAFPKGAVVVEAEDINGDWFWGVYAGNKGVFPGNYGRVVG